MAKKGSFHYIFFILLISILIFGCEEKKAVPEEKELVALEEEEAITSTPVEPQQETVVEYPPVETEVKPVKQEFKISYNEEFIPSSSSKCNCVPRWDPVCGEDGKTYLNKCLYECSGHDEETMASNVQCPKKKSSIIIYTDDTVNDFESEKYMGGYCWRNMWRDEGLRRCENIIVNGQVGEAPIPEKGDWLSHTTYDRSGSIGSTIRLAAGETASNEEYNTSFQPLFEKGRYRFSFWARQNTLSNNDWKVRLLLRDWNGQTPRPEGIKGCYMLSTTIYGNEYFIETEPNEWRRYNYEFDLPLDDSQWQSAKRMSADCEYEWDMMPHGYRIDVSGPGFGEALFDDFELIKIE